MIWGFRADFENVFHGISTCSFCSFGLYVHNFEQVLPKSLALRGFVTATGENAFSAAREVVQFQIQKKKHWCRIIIGPESAQWWFASTVMFSLHNTFGTACARENTTQCPKHTRPWSIHWSPTCMQGCSRPKVYSCAQNLLGNILNVVVKGVDQKIRSLKYIPIPKVVSRLKASMQPSLRLTCIFSTNVQV